MDVDLVSGDLKKKSVYPLNLAVEINMICLMSRDNLGGQYTARDTRFPLPPSQGFLQKPPQGGSPGGFLVPVCTLYHHSAYVVVPAQNIGPACLGVF